jgi:SAM-dependent methyltransferase
LDNFSEFIRKAMLKLIRVPLHRQRSNLLKLFVSNFSPSQATICIDIGGTTEGFESLGLKCNAISANIEVRNRFEGWHIILADGRILPFRDRSVDVVVSNALLEHVNEGRDKLVGEIKRVSKGSYFVSVPYFYSPLEPHYLLPFFQFVPESFRKLLLFKLGLTIGWMNKHTYHRIRLFTKSQLRILFPEAQITVLKSFGIPVSLVAWNKGQ